MPAYGQELVFATVEDARRILSAEDAYATRLRPFERAARMKTGQRVSIPQYLKHAASSAMAWNDAEKKRISAAYKTIKPALERLAYSMPEQVYLIKTSGDEEGHAAYTRADAVMLPVDMISTSDRELRKLLAHELFHVYSRANPEILARLYATIGFEHCGEPDYPPGLTPLLITNPDALANDYCVPVDVAGKTVSVTPVLYFKSKYDPSAGGEFIDHMELALMVVKSGHDNGDDDSSMPEGTMLDFDQVAGFFEKVGMNTEYVIHPAEILAVNFSLLVLDDTDVPSPDILVRMRKVLLSARIDSSSPEHKSSAPETTLRSKERFSGRTEKAKN